MAVRVELLTPGARRGPQVVSGTISLPRVGAWHADLVVDAPEALAGAFDLRLTETLSLRGTVSRGSVLEGLFRCRMVAGADGLRKAAVFRHYTTPTLKVVLGFLLDEAGEKLSATADVGVLGTQFQHWTTWPNSTAQEIRALVSRAGEPSWRFLPDGTLWLGSDTFPESTLQPGNYTIFDADPDDDVLGVGLLEPALLPGVTLGGYKLDTVEMTLDRTGVKAKVWTIP